jgi:hypothetical protein
VILLSYDRGGHMMSSKISLNEETIIADVIKQYPFIKDILVKLNPSLKRLNNPILLNVIGKKATLKMISDKINIEPDQLILLISTEIKRHQLKNYANH